MERSSAGLALVALPGLCNSDQEQLSLEACDPTAVAQGRAEARVLNTSTPVGWG